MKKKKPKPPEVFIEPHAFFPETHSMVTVHTARGRAYWHTWAGTPTLEQVLDAWKNDRSAFQPKNF